MNLVIFEWAYLHRCLDPKSIAILISLWSSASFSSEQSFVISHPDVPPLTTSYSAKKILEHAYSTLGISVKFKESPAKRSLRESNTGKNDAELARIKGVDSHYKNLIRIKVPIAEQNLYAYTTRKHISIDGWRSLKPYSIGFIRGFLLAEANTHGFEITQVNSPAQLIRLLSYGRLDVIIELESAKCFFNSSQSIKIYQIEPPVTTFKMYHYVHNKHENLVRKLENIIQQMYNSGKAQVLAEEAKHEFKHDCSELANRHP